MVDAFGAIANPVRRQIVTQLAVRPRSVAELAGTAPVSRPAVSQHLRVLLEIGLVSHDRVGRQHVYRLNAEKLNVVRGWLAHLDGLWGSALDRLGKHLDHNP